MNFNHLLELDDSVEFRLFSLGGISVIPEVIEFQDERLHISTTKIVVYYGKIIEYQIFRGTFQCSGERGNVRPKPSPDFNAGG